MKLPRIITVGLCILALLGIVIGFERCTSLEQVDSSLETPLPAIVDYNYHIKPILSDRCYSCHGPDANTREADLRLDTEEGAFEILAESGKKALEKGSLRNSELWNRINHEDKNELMPPPESNLSLSPYEIALIGKWIEQGAEWKPHWAFIPPTHQAPPTTKNKTWGQNEIDGYILAELERNGLSPSPEAQKERLLRRLSFDLRGLPPSLEEIDEFLADSSEQAYEYWVDRFLASSSFGERMALDWMDVARYADSHGLHADGWRNMWPWRDWVIQAFNQNMPYDQFILDQIAGDMLPGKTKEQILATAFHRNHQMTAEGGIIEEEYRLEYVYDRTNTTATAFLGITMECARCHDHKFDPISQKEYYQLAAFFNNVKELGMTGDDGNYGPILMMASDTLSHKIDQIDEKLDGLKTVLQKNKKEVAALKTFLEDANPSMADLRSHQLIHLPLESVNTLKDKKGNKGQRADREITTTVTGEVELIPGKIGKAFRFDNDYDVLYIGEEGRFEITDPFSVGMWVHPEKRGEHQTLIGNSGNKNNYWRGWELTLDTSNHISVKFIHSLPHNYFHKQTETSIPLNEWTHVLFTYDGKGTAEGLHLYINGKEAESQVYFDRLSRSMKTVTPNHQPDNRALRIAKSYRAFTGDNGIFLGALDDIRLFGIDLTHLEINTLLGLKGKASPEEKLNHFLVRKSPEYAGTIKQVEELHEQRLHILDTLPEVMVMEEMPTPRTMYLYDRGQYDLPTEEVEATTPSSILNFPTDYPRNRVGLSKWITNPENPLTGRVTVNRYWQMIFGRGLVSTPQDFGNQGTLPTHPELLDALALRFVKGGWDVKALIKYMVMSATYRQDSKVRPELQEIDPDNLLLARGPSYRLPAEMIRDNALSVSNLLNPQVGGPSVKPYQPKGLWIDKGSFSPRLLRYKADTLFGMHRRSLYTFIRRTSPPPSMQAFDAPTRSICTVQRQVTNTPMQALVLLNDPQFVEAARKMGERILQEGGKDLGSQLEFGFRLATSRKAIEEEIQLFRDLYQSELEKYKSQTEEAHKLLEVGISPVESSVPSEELAAMTIVSSMMLNHDEAYMKR
ncbi:MAG: DUF1553 domain-containing protein [Bacteroidota bacterium]